MKYLRTLVVVCLVLVSTGCFGGPPRQSGVFISRDSGLSWVATPDLTNKQTKDAKQFPPLEVTAVAVSAQSADAVVAGTTDNLYQSGDGGRTWELLTNRLPSPRRAVSVQTIAFSPGDRQVYYVGGVAGGYGKVYKTTDGGKTFRDFFTVSQPRQAVTALLVDSGNNEVIYAGDQLGGVYKSADGAASWRRVLSVAAPVTALTASGDSLYVGTAGQGVFRSSDGGSSFAAINGNTPGQGLAGASLTVWSLGSGLGGLFAGTDQGLLATRDFGVTWTSVGNPLPPRGERVQAVIVSQDHVYFATNAVVYQGSASGDRFVPVQLKLAEHVFGLAASRSDPGVLYAAANAESSVSDRFSRGLPELVKPF